MALTKIPGSLINSADNLTITDLTVTGNLNITGDINSYNVTDLDVTDQTITLGAGQIEANSGGSGIIVDGSGASILWDEPNDWWDYNKGIRLDGEGLKLSFRTSSTSSDGEIYTGDTFGSNRLIIAGDNGIHNVIDGNANGVGDWSIYNDNTSTHLLYVTGSNGHVGIGTSSPSYKLEVAGDASFLGQDVLIDSQSGYKELRHTQTGENFAISSPESLYFLIDSNNNQTNRSIVFAHNNTIPGSATELMRIGEDGNVGIGTSTTFSNPLTLNKSAGAAGSLNNQLALTHTGASTAYHIKTIRAAATDEPAGLAFVENTTERMRITSGGTVSIGNTSPNPVKLHVGDTSHNDLISGTQLLVSGTSAGAVALGLVNGNGTGVCNILFGSTNDGNKGEIAYNLNSDFMQFNTNNSEAMRINANRQLTINSTISNVQGKIFIDHTGADTDNWGLRFLSTSSNNPVYIVDFIDYQGQRMGSIQGNPSANTITYGTSSDYRLKENVSYDWDATTRLKQLKPARFNWIRDESNTLVDGFLAHEVENIVPEAISGEKDAIETNSNVVLNSYGNLIDKNITESEWTAGKENGTYDADTSWEESHTQNVYQSIDQSKLVPLLVKTIQELEARITELENA